ncbi:CRISPR-associated endonuclease Cas2 [Hyphobacterium indicum]|uniref:CRISPR-associated endonuclease Cas2 n=1 Tax=Hyphobacterium indicum TaxID=2162714 RepID=UPI000D656C25|nr:CRISPR-associated endonuclease Cas2 [Hyphobacterium indicum]
MWMMVVFDLPVTEIEPRKAANRFRLFLKDLGFEMAQFSVYVRHTPGKEAIQSLLSKIEAALPAEGKIDILQFTDKQYERIISFRGRCRGPDKKAPNQYEMF